MKNLIILSSSFLLLTSHILVAQNHQWLIPDILPFGVGSVNNIDILDDGQVWVCTHFSGVLRYQNHTWTQFDSYTPISHPGVHEVVKDSSGRIWMATQDKISIYDPSNGSWQYQSVVTLGGLGPFDSVVAIEIDEDGRVWVGSGGGGDASDGLYFLNDSIHYHSGNSPLGSNWIVSMKKDKNGHIWACTKSLVQIVDTTLTGIPMSSIGMPNNTLATDISFTSNNHMWVSTWGGGVAYFDGSSWTIYNSSNSPLPQNDIWSITVDPNDHVWIGSSQKGVVKFDGTNWTIYNEANSSLPSDRIQSIRADSAGNIWIGAATFSGQSGISILKEDGFASISGTVFHDSNADSTYQSGEQGLAHAVIEINPGGYYGITDSLGEYEIFILDTGAYTVTPHLNHPWTTQVYPGSATGILSPGLLPDMDTADFAVQLTPDMRDISITATPYSPARPGFDLIYQLRVENRGTVRIDSIEVRFTPDNILSVDSATGSYTTIVDTLYWQIDSLQIAERRSFDIFFTVPPNPTLLGQMIQSKSRAVISHDSLPANNLHHLNQTIVGSYDPNDKMVHPQGIGPNGYIPLETDQFEYKIRFQNTGTDTAFRIVVVDTLSSLLDITSFRTIAASHPYTLELEGHGVVKWIFDDILLPDSHINEAASHGFIRYEIAPRESISLEDTLLNKADIYFDFNPPITTNTTMNIFSVLGDVSVRGETSNAARPGFGYVYHLTVENEGLESVEDVELRFVQDDLLELDSSSVGHSMTGDTLIWPIDSLQTAGQYHVDVFFTLPADPALIGMQMISTAHVFLAVDSATENNSNTFFQTISGSYGSSSKTVSPIGDSTYGYVPLDVGEFEYQISFQNIGTDTAFHIVVIDTLSPNLDTASIQIVETSHPYTFHLEEGIATWTFDNILLPDSNTNAPASHGFIQYSIPPDTGVSYGDTITNRAEVYVDHNPSSATNTTLNTFYDFSLSIVTSNLQSSELIVFPNPTTGQLHIKGTSETVFPLTIKLFTMEGKQILHESGIMPQERIMLQDPVSSLIFYQINDRHGKLVGKGKIMIE
ncbi:MAG: two-component regulator propeller domain-containing protein [Bacteroidota bacterium]